jgi:hypothetical protein
MAARRHGYESAAKAESFYVHDLDGPLLDGEIDRARAWGRQLAVSIAKSNRLSVINLRDRSLDQYFAADFRHLSSPPSARTMR